MCSTCDMIREERDENARLQAALRVAKTETVEAINQTRSHSERMDVLRRERDRYKVQSERQKKVLEMAEPIVTTMVALDYTRTRGIVTGSALKWIRAAIDAPEEEG